MVCGQLRLHSEISVRAQRAVGKEGRREGGAKGTRNRRRKEKNVRECKW